MRVLLVDDAPPARETLAALLEDEGYEVVEAGSLEEARRCASAEPFGLAIVDRNLPDGDGADLVRELKQLEPQPVVVVLSGTAGEVEGARLCVEKGGAAADLLAAITGLVEPRR